MRRTLIALCALTAALGCRQRGAERQAQPAAGAPAAAATTTPASYQVKFETSAGPFVVEVTRAWAPLGADRFYALVQQHFYDGTRFFRVVPGFIVQFGLNGTPTTSAHWHAATIPDDPVAQHNVRGTVTFATAGPNTRTTQLFINYADNSRLDGMGFAPFGRVVAGMDVVDRLYAKYGERPDQGAIETIGNSYLAKNFPKLDSIAKATILSR